MKKKIFFVFGTRPEAIKMAPIIKQMEKDANYIIKTIITGQHKTMIYQVLNFFQIDPDYDLNIMTNEQTLTSITIKILDQLTPILIEEKPDMILVHGDTTTTLVASLAAFYQKITVCHVEAGLRTKEKYSPFPEELNRQLTDVIADLYFAPTNKSRANLLAEGHVSSNIFVTGNTAIDAMKYTINPEYQHPLLKQLKDKKIILLTVHRRENLGEPMKNIFKALNRVVLENKDIEIIFPVHKNPKVRNLVKKYLQDNPQIHLIEPLDVVEFHNLANNCYFILTDSGGIQEEAPSLGKPVLVLRDTTERPEGIEMGTLKLIGTTIEKVYMETNRLIQDKKHYLDMSRATNPYGDGHASERIHQIINKFFSTTTFSKSE